MKVIELLSNKKTEMIVCIFFTVVMFILLMFKKQLFFPLVILFALMLFTGDGGAIYAVAAMVCAGIGAISGSFPIESSTLITEILFISTALFFLAAAMQLMLIAGAGETVANLILGKSRTCRRYLVLLCIVTMVFSFVPEFGAAVGAGLFSKSGKRIGVSAIKTAMLSSMTAVIVSSSVLLLSVCPSVLTYIRQGLDAAGGRNVPEIGFVISSFQFFYFHISAVVIIVMSIMNLREIRGPLNSKRAASNVFNITAFQRTPDQKRRKENLLLVTVSTIALLIGLLMGGCVDLTWPKAILMATILFLVVVLIILAMQKRLWIISEFVSNEVLRSTLRRLTAILTLFMTYILVQNTKLYTALVNMITPDIGMLILTLLSFLFSALTAFITGSNLISFALFLPIVLPVAWDTHENAIFYTMVIGGIFSGATAGVLLAPHAPVNVIASLFAGCSHGAHMSEQALYTLLSMVCAYLMGFLPISIGFTSPFGLLITMAGTYALYDTISRPVDAVKSNKMNIR